jgi:methylthioribose-1-phosphate isomerase
MPPGSIPVTELLGPSTVASTPIEPPPDPAPVAGATEPEPSPEPVPEPVPEPAAEPAAAVEGADLARRLFFRRFAGEVVQTAATVVGAAAALQRSSAEAASALLGPDGAAGMMIAGGPEAGIHAPTGFRTPFRFASDDLLLVIDQRRLPEELVEIEIRSAPDATWAIRQMVVRGAPAIGQVAAYGLALTAGIAQEMKPYARRATLHGAAKALKNSRPTAVNLRWAVDRLLARYEAWGELSPDGPAIAEALRDEADQIAQEATLDHGRLAEFGLAELPVPEEDRPVRVLTHCNTGPLACGQFGTALGVVQAAHNVQRPIHVWVDETRPYLQGARLTAWELAQAGVPHTLVADVAAGHLMATGQVDAVLVGADRVAANGDTANKIGTYALAVLAARHGVPFLVCAPLSSVDPETPDGTSIPIEERKADEVLFVRGQAIAPPGTDAFNPAFDITPAELITAIVTEEGALRRPFGPAIEAAIERSRVRRAEALQAAARAADETVATEPADKAAEEARIRA